METMAQENSVRELARAYGIQPDWKDIWGNVHHVTDDMYRALLSGMEVPASSQQDIDRSFAQLRHETSARWLEPAKVISEAEDEIRIELRLPESLHDKPLRWTLTLESGEQKNGEIRTGDLAHIGDFELPEAPEKISRYLFTLDEVPPQGYHRLALLNPENNESVDMLLVITPTSCYFPEVLRQENGKVWGPAVQLYAVHSSRNWGMGDFTDLQRIIDWCSEEGASLVGLNPLHSLFPHNTAHCSPYSPSSRIFFNALYLDPEAIPDFAESEEARQLVYSPAFQEELSRLREAEYVEYGEAGRRKLDVLELLYQNFCKRHLAQQTERARAFQAYVENQGKVLERFALFHAIQERFHKEDPNIWGWPVWPEAYRDPEAKAVQEFAQTNKERVGFYQYLQWQVDEQLHIAGVRCLKKHLGVGLYMDMAVGVDRGGADVWSNQHLFAKSSAVGAPPDELNQKGQDWGLPPLIPERMREEQYESYIDILRQNMKYSGALRIDHVMGLFRLFWIPPNLPPSQGAYIHYPVDELFGILALESVRNQCMVIGEDMGTVPPEVQERMRQWGVYSYKVFFFEKESAERFKQPEEYLDTAAVAVSTHDLPTLAGFWEGRDIAVRTELDLYPNKDLRDRQIKDRVMERVAILHLLEDQDLLPEGVNNDPASVPTMTPALSTAVHALLARTRSKVYMVQFEDMLQQVDQINLPGTTEPMYPNWRRKLTLPLEDLLTDRRVKEIANAIREERPRWVSPEKKNELGTEGEPTLSIPRATYRFQFNKDFTFRQAAELVPYLSKLGISHCYASPLLQAREGSVHGYDITNHQRLNPEIGTPEDLEHLCTVLHQHGMGLIVDIVPNHMGAGKDNPWWMDVLENGRSSMYADYFDIDWHPLADDLENKILLSILGGAYGKILENGELKLRFDEQSGRFWLDYYENAIPINPNSYPVILSHRLQVLEARLGHKSTALAEYQSIISAFEHLPQEAGNNHARKEERLRERTIALSRLTALIESVPEVRQFIEENVQDFHTGKDDPTTLSRLNRLLEQQAYRLSNWRVASDEINYRRFFDVNDLVAVRVEDPRVFNDTHSLIMDLIERGLINGLRIDHPDGLFDPAGYFRRLQQEAARRLDLPEEQWSLSSPNLPLYVLIEKILAPFERLPEEWTVEGTTGYEFANAVNGIFVRQENEKELTRVYEKLLGRQVDFEDLVYQAKKLIMKTTLNSELGVLSHQLSRISKRNWSTRDFTLHNLRSAIIEVVACFPVYRTYVTPDGISKKDREYIDWAVRAAKRRSTATDTTIFDFLREVLLLEAQPENAAEANAGAEVAAFQQAVTRFAMKFQQYTGPVMAKGMEDTSFYRYNRLVSLNEVGGEPHQFGISLSTFHHQNIERAKRVPHTLLATSTHDTKRSEDVRARISVLSELPNEWQKRLSTWRRIHRRYRKTIEEGLLSPSPNDEYLFYQTLLGVWPLNAPDETERQELANRLQQYMLKAVKEAKTHTSWINPNQEYENALSDFVRQVVLNSPEMFFEDFLPFQRMVARLGLFNSLSQTLLKLTCPGVPDIYQGNEVWDFSLVDPDNRRAVDYARRREMLDRLSELPCDADSLKPLLQELTANLADGRIKQFVTGAVLKLRADEPDVFAQGNYLPLDVSGAWPEHVVAFARSWQDVHVIALAPRQLYSMGVHRNELPFGKRIWRDTAVTLPPSLPRGAYRNVLTGETLETGESLALAEAFKDLPLALLVSKAQTAGR